MEEGKHIIFLNRVISSLLKDTHIDHVNEELFFNFMTTDSLRGPYPLNAVLFFIRTPFSKYCKSYYGLNDDEINYVWKSYKTILEYKINKGIINESEDKQKRYLDKVVEFIVRDTRIDIGNGQYRFHTPFSQSPQHSWFPSAPINVYYTLSKYCNDTYGLTEEEIDYVWEKYKTIIDSKITPIV